MAMFYRNSQGNIINLDNVREIVKHEDITVRERNSDKTYKVSEAAYYIKKEVYRALERFADSKTLNRFMGWLWERIEMEAPYCSFEEFASLRIVSDEPKYDPKKVEDNRNFLKEVAKKLEEVAEEVEDDEDA